jgi:hypothetical protein
MIFPQILGDVPYSCHYIVAEPIVHFKGGRADAQDSGTEEQSGKDRTGKGQFRETDWNFLAFMRFSRNILIKIHRMSLAFFDFSCIISLD